MEKSLTQFLKQGLLRFMAHQIARSKLEVGPCDI